MLVFFTQAVIVFENSSCQGSVPKRCLSPQRRSSAANLGHNVLSCSQEASPYMGVKSASFYLNVPTVTYNKYITADTIIIFGHVTCCWISMSSSFE